MWSSQRLHVYPIVTAVLFPVTFLSTYAIAVLLGHTEINWPYISDTSAYPPESCVFGQFVNIGAVLVAVVAYIRFRQVRMFYKVLHASNACHRVNLVSLWIGWIGALGISVVANFQETAVLRVHLLGAFTAFGMGIAYMWTQVFASYCLCLITHGACLKYFRCSLAIVGTVAFVVMIVTGVEADLGFHGNDPSKWYPAEGGWRLHLASTATEWMVAATFDVFLLTFVPEFKKVALNSPQVVDLGLSRLELLAHQDNDLPRSPPPRWSESLNTPPTILSPETSRNVPTSSGNPFEELDGFSFGVAAQTSHSHL